MKRLKNHNKTLCGIEYRDFRILKNQRTNKYIYYVNIWDSKILGKDLMRIGRSENKIKIYNKYTLPFFGFLINILHVLAIPFLIIMYLPLRYCYGGIAFVKDSFDVTDVRFFNWTNIILLLTFIVCRFLGYI